MARYKDINSLSESELLDTRICDLGISIKNEKIQGRIHRLYLELFRKGLKFRPHIWISDEWFSPDGVPGFAIPFYLFHPRLQRLEKKMMNEVEGGNLIWFMKLSRHETGHAIDNAFRLRKNKRRQELFGLTSEEYPDFYTPNILSEDYVLHLEGHYAQAHPDEDWAETFATWLTPKSNWKKNYSGTLAFEKLELVDIIMSSLKGISPMVKNKKVMSHFRNNKKTLREYYQEKRKRYLKTKKNYFKNDLEKIFTKETNQRIKPTAVQFLRNHRKDICRHVSKHTSYREYTIDNLMEEIIGICRQKRLKLKTNTKLTKKMFLRRLTYQTKKHIAQPRFNKVYM